MKFRVTETSNGNFQDAEGSLPFDIAGLGPDGATVRVKIWNTSAGSAAIVPPYNEAPPQVAGTPDVGQTASMIGDVWYGASLFNDFWYVDGVQVATTATYTIQAGDRGKTITAARQAQGVGGSVASAIIASTNGLYIPASGGDGTLDPNEYAFREALADADTRKTYVEVYDVPPGGYEWIAYRGTASAGDLAFVAALTFDGTKYVWTSTGQAAVGTGPNGRTPVYVRIGLREIATPTNKYFVTPAGENFLATSIPGAPSVSYAQGAGQGEIYVTINSAADGAGRAVTGYEYQLDGGAWVTLPGGTATGQRTINTGVPTTSYSISVRAVNINGSGIATGPEFAFSGAVTVAPSAFADGDWFLNDKPSTLGDKLTVGFTVLPSNGGGTITDVEYQINAGAWVPMGATPTSVDITVPATTLANVQIRAVNSAGNGATATKARTPTTIAAASTTAYFGADTIALAGSWKPETALGDEVELTGIVSQVGMTRTWSIVGGGLVANGTPGVDNTKTLTVSTASGNIVVTISTVANAWSVANGTELAAALAATNGAPATVFLRPRLFDLGRGTGSTTPTGLGVFQGRVYTGTNRRTVDKHTGQIKKPWSVDTKSLLRTTQYLTIKNFRFTTVNRAFFDQRITTNDSGAFLWVDNGNGGGTIDFYCDNCDFEAPDIAPEVLNDPTPWPAGYTGPTAIGMKLYNTPASCIGAQITNCTFKNLYYAAELPVRGNFKLNNNTVDTYYFDAFRLYGYVAAEWSGSQDFLPKEITGNTVINAFGYGDEVLNNGAFTASPHTDAMQLQKGNIEDCLIWKNIFVPGAYRANKTSSMQTNGKYIRCTIGGLYMNGPDGFMSWGMNGSGGYLNFTGVTWLHDNNGGSQVRISPPTPGDAIGEILLKNFWARQGAASGIEINGAANALIDAVRTVQDSTVLTTAGTSITANFNYSTRPATIAAAIAAATPKVGSAADTNGYGALTTAGAWRYDEWPPMHGEPPTVANSAANLIITPSASKLAHTTPTNWEYAYRNSNASSWTEVTGLSGANATLVAPNKVNIQVMARWVGTNGLKGTWSRAQTTII
jgi:hypothetical protein